MLLPNRISKITLYLAVLFGSLWTGVYMLRTLLVYQIFEGTELGFREYITEENLSGIYNVLNPAIASTFFFYILFLVFFITFLLVSRINLRRQGWLFIITSIIVITVPFEIYLMTFDYKIMINLNREIFDPPVITELLRERIKFFGSFPLVQLFSYFSFYYLILFRPLTHNED